MTLRPPTAEPRSDTEIPPYSIASLVALHLAPGVALGAFVVLVSPVLDRWGIDPVFALFGGICVIIVPAELGYLSLYAKRTIGSWSPLAAVRHEQRLATSRLLATAAGLGAWFLVVLTVSIAMVDRPLADTVFAWLPDPLLQFSEVDADTADPGLVAFGALIFIALIGNGIAGPITEELYFRGHLLPRMEQLGDRAPILNTTLFALYHVWTPWRWPAILIGFLPTTLATWKSRDLRLSIATHVGINLIFLAMLAAAYVADS